MEPLDRRILPAERLVSLDTFRGLTMIFLVSSSFGLSYLRDIPSLRWLGLQFTHHPWNGLYFWDLIQPFFMFIVGVAMPFSFAKRWERGETWNQSPRTCSQTFRDAALSGRSCFTAGTARPMCGNCGMSSRSFRSPISSPSSS
jgi:predicted acyltransferase